MHSNVRIVVQHVRVKKYDIAALVGCFPFCSLVNVPKVCSYVIVDAEEV